MHPSSKSTQSVQVCTHAQPCTGSVGPVPLCIALPARAPMHPSKAPPWVCCPSRCTQTLWATVMPGFVHACAALLCRLVAVQRVVLGPGNPVLLTTLTSLAMVCHQVRAQAAGHAIAWCVAPGTVRGGGTPSRTARWWCGCGGAGAVVWVRATLHAGKQATQAAGVGLRHQPHPPCWGRSLPHKRAVRLSVWTCAVPQMRQACSLVRCLVWRFACMWVVRASCACMPKSFPCPPCWQSTHTRTLTNVHMYTGMLTCS